MSNVTSADGVLHGPWHPGINWSMDEAGIEVVAMRMQLRFMKATSPLYSE